MTDENPYTKVAVLIVTPEGVFLKRESPSSHEISPLACEFCVNPQDPAESLLAELRKSLKTSVGISPGERAFNIEVSIIKGYDCSGIVRMNRSKYLDAAVSRGAYVCIPAAELRNVPLARLKRPATGFYMNPLSYTITQEILALLPR